MKIFLYFSIREKQLKKWHREWKINLIQFSSIQNERFILGDYMNMYSFFFTGEKEKPVMTAFKKQKWTNKKFNKFT
jgi:hypothetical protein